MVVTKNIAEQYLKDDESFSYTYLHEIPIQRIMLMIHELFNAGSFDSVIRV